VHAVLAGASGLIGTALGRSLRADGHTVTALVRRAPRSSDELRWEPAAGRLDPAALAGADAVVCLSGAGVGDKRWTPSYKETLIRSRVDSVTTIARAIADAESGPRVLLSASAVGYYGDTGDREVDESAAPGEGFLADMCVRWEAAAEAVEQPGTRVARLRTGLVLAPDGGLLARLRPIVRLGVAGRFGSGRQFMPWISLADEVRAIRFLLEHELGGPVNLTGPVPVRNSAFISTLARLLRRPALIPTPALAMRIVLGEVAQDALTGQRAVPAKLTSAGFAFEHADVDSALRWALAG
jgi:uncharacterized protein (TIGR01777 family)